MLTSTRCYEKYGDPNNHKNMEVWLVPTELAIGQIPKKIYCNRDLKKPLEQAFRNIIDRGCLIYVKTWDGCHNIRSKRGMKSMSLHSWGVAIDINAASNPLGAEPTMEPELVKCFTDAGFEWGGYWKSRKDGMHFQLKSI